MPLSGACSFSPGIRECVPAMDKKIEAAGIPFYSENIELVFIKRSRDKRQRSFLSTGHINIMTVEGLINHRIPVQVFHHVNLSALRPAAINAFLRHEPDGGP